MPDHRIEPLLDEAIASYPLAPLPRDFVARTMVRVIAEPHPAPGVATPHPRLGFLDLALPVFAALLTVVVTLFLALAWWMRDALAVAAFGLHVRLVWLSLAQRWMSTGDASLTPVVIVGLAGLVSVVGATVLTVAVMRPRFAT